MLCKKGHHAQTCPNKKGKKGQIHTMAVESDIEDEDGVDLGFIFHHNLSVLNLNICILIDSNVDTFKNAKLLTNIHQVKKL